MSSVSARPRACECAPRETRLEAATTTTFYELRYFVLLWKRDGVTRSVTRVPGLGIWKPPTQEGPFPMSEKANRAIWLLPPQKEK